MKAALKAAVRAGFAHSEEGLDVEKELGKDAASSVQRDGKDTPSSSLEDVDAKKLLNMVMRLKQSRQQILVRLFYFSLN